MPQHPHPKPNPPAHPRPSALLMAVAAVGLAGCSVLGLPSFGGDDKGAVKPPPATVSHPGRKVVLVGLEQAGARVELGLDQQLQVRLLTPVAAAPEWSLIGPLPANVSVQGPRFEPDVRGNVSGEVEGDTVWQIRPTAAGSVLLRFEYRRPRNTAPATQVVTFDVVIK